VRLSADTKSASVTLPVHLASPEPTKIALIRFQDRVHKDAPDRILKVPVDAASSDGGETWDDLKFRELQNAVLDAWSMRKILSYVAIREHWCSLFSVPAHSDEITIFQHEEVVLYRVVITFIH
jgi:hypothetical protein